MIRSEIISWVNQEFEPVQLVTGSETISQFIGNAIRYLNTHSAFRYGEMLTVSSGTQSIQVSTNIKTVVKALVTPPQEWITQNYPQWSLLGISMLDSVNNDLIMMTEAFKNYKAYISGDYKWYFEASSDPSVGGTMYFYNLPQNVTRVYALGTRRFKLDNETDDLNDEHALRWVLEYTKALTKQAEGNALRKSSAIGVSNDGQQLYQEGREEMLALQKQIFEEARWLCFAKRF